MTKKAIRKTAQTIIAGFILLYVPFVFGPIFVAAQQVSFGDGTHDSSASIKVTADMFSYDEGGNLAAFRGDVRAEQDGTVMLSDEAVIYYSDDGDVVQIVATGNVIITTDRQSAKAERAIYTPANNILEMSGKEVILLDGANMISGRKLVVEIDKGTGTMSGRTSIILQPKKKQ